MQLINRLRNKVIAARKLRTSFAAESGGRASGACAEACNCAGASPQAGW